MRRRRIRIALTLLCVLPLFACSPNATGAPDAPPSAADTQWAGVYYLSGVREVGAELRLSAEGRFGYGIAYGGAEGSAEGRWSIHHDTVTLITDPVLPISLKLGEIKPDLIDDYASGDKPTALVVKVIVPRLGWVWSNMDVTAEFSNGLTRSGLTSGAGAIGFVDRTDGPWKGAVVRRVSVGYSREKVDPVWFDVDATKTKSLIVHFEPGRLGPPPAFTSMTMTLQKDSSGAKSLLQSNSDGPGKTGWTFRQ